MIKISAWTEYLRGGEGKEFFSLIAQKVLTSFALNPLKIHFETEMRQLFRLYEI